MNLAYVYFFFFYSYKKSVWVKRAETKIWGRRKKIILCAFLSSFNATNEDIISLELKLRVFPMSVRIRAWCEWVTDFFLRCKCFLVGKTARISPSWFKKIIRINFFATFSNKSRLSLPSFLFDHLLSRLCWWKFDKTWGKKHCVGEKEMKWVLEYKVHKLSILLL